MKRNLPRGLGLTALTLLWLTLSTWVLLGVPRSGYGNSANHEEPPPSRTIWDRIGEKATSLLRRHDADSPQEEIRQLALRMGVVDWHRAGHTGKGLKVAILDSGFRNYKTALGKFLPEKVTVKSFRKDENLEARESQHGILCAEVIHQLAPHAEILFANWEPDQPQQFLAAMRWARSQGAQIISCSIIMPTWSDGEGGGPIHKDLAQILGDGTKKSDALLFVSAGNTALRHWSGSFTPTKDGWHQWAWARKENLLRPLSDDRISVELYGPGEACYELTVHDTQTDRILERVKTTTQTGYFSGSVRFYTRESDRYSVRLRLVSSPKGKDPGRFHLTVLNGKLTHVSKLGSIPFPGDGGEAVCVSAVDTKGRRQSYSSCGPNGNCPKPDLCACVPFPSLFRPEQPFSGTSAAAPQAAALAALVWSKEPRMCAADVRKTLVKSATTQAKSHCPECGHGLLHLP